MARLLYSATAADGTRTEGFVTRPVIEDRLNRTAVEARP